ncbi:MAG TPA: hypothetical protein ENL42_00960, partial [Thermoplasmatales archaeon]|nr:hypothetical protein [Thermoplasmatales archaeon]
MKKIIAAVVMGVFLFGAAIAGVNNVTEETAPSTDNVIQRTYEFEKPVVREDGNYVILSLDGTKTTMQEGMPTMPYKVDVMRFPAGTKLEIEMGAIKTMEMELPAKIKPYPMYTLLTTQGRIEMREGKIYATAASYPENWIEPRITVGLYNGERVVTLSLFLYPCKYIPAENKLLYTDKIDVTIKYEPPKKPLFTKDEYDLLIIAPDSWMDELQPLKEHKEQHGIKTIIVGLDEIYSGKYFAAEGRDDAEKIKYFIKNAIEEWGIEYVMLV